MQPILSDYYLKGVKLAFITALISGFAVFVNKFGISLWVNSSVYTTAKNIIAAVLLTGLLIALKKIPELKKLTMRQWLKLLLIGLIGGSVPFLLFFKSLTLIPAPEAAFIHKTLFLWVALLAVPFLKERLTMVQMSALGILFVGVFLFGAPTDWVFGVGSLMALAATFLWAVENVLAKTMLKTISSTLVGWARMFIGSLILLGYLAVTGDIAGIIPSSWSQFGITLLVGAVLFGYVITWYSALKHAPATIVSAVLVIAAPITTFLNALFVAHVFPHTVIVPTLIIVLALVIITRMISYIYAVCARTRTSDIQTKT